MNLQTKEGLLKLKLPAFMEVFHEITANTSHPVTTEEALTMMVDRELLQRKNKRIERLLKAAKLRYPQATVAAIDYSDPKRFNQNQMRTITHCEWITKNKNVIFTGPTGTGKSFLACALGQQACQLSYKVRYFRVTRLIEQLRLSHADGSYTRILEQLSKVNLIILDDWGIDQLDRQARRDLLEVLEDRYDKSSTVITSQLPIASWHHFIGDDTIADAVCDRVVNNAYRVEVQGESKRKSENLP